MRVVHYSFILIILSFMGACKSSSPIADGLSRGSTNVVPVFDANNAVSESVVYGLPKTMLRFKIKAEKVYERRGPLYQYSKLYLDIDKPVIEEKTEWILKEIEVSSVGVLDESQLYKVEFSGNTGAGNIELTENGCIKSVNVDVQENDEVCELIEALPQKEIDTSFVDIPLMEELLRSNSTSKMAEEAAALIYRLRENRVALVSGELEYFPANGESLNLSLDQIKRLEKQYVSLFAGKKDSEIVELSFDYVPEAAVTREILFRFSKYKGLVASDDFSGSPVLITLVPDHLLNLPANERQPMYDDKGDIVEDLEKNGFFYRLPANCKLELEYNAKKLDTRHLNIAQFGKVLSLPADLLDTNEKGIIYYPETGAIKKIVKH